MIDISGHLRNTRQECGFEDHDNFLVVNCCGYQKFISKDFSRSREKGRLDYQILYITKGSALFTIKGETVEVPEGNLVIYHPNEEQHYIYHYKNSPEVYWIHFTGFGVKEILESSGINDVSICYIGLSNSCIDVFKRMINELQVKRPLFDNLVSGLFMELLSIMGRRRLSQEATSNEKSAAIQKVLEAMHTGYPLKWSVKDFAKMCNLSTYRFIHIFKEHTGYSPIEYLISIRMDKAKEFLLDSDLNISEISTVIGYENPLFFSRIFKKNVGVSPRSYKKQVQT